LGLKVIYRGICPNMYPDQTKNKDDKGTRDDKNLSG